MYIPASFREERLDVVHQLIQSYPFASLVTELNGRPFATHLPFLLDPARGAFGTLMAHMARANPQWRGFEPDREALVIFHGPHAYISPSWYATHPAVPTWNYAVVHVYGSPRPLGETELRDLLQATAAVYEPDDAARELPGEYFEKMAAGVVGFEMEITSLEGKFKLSQNRSAEDQTRVAAALQASGTPGDGQLADLMRSRLSS